MIKFILFLVLFIASNLFSQKDELIIFHAGSFSKPMEKLIEVFRKENPNVNVKREIAGSVECARKITELNKPCDVFVSSDYQVINNFLIPNYANWNLKFATNEIVIAFTQKSKRAKEISIKNWFSILSNDKIKIARSEPNLDPCGYRTVLALKLAEKFYRVKQLSKKILEKNPELIRPKEVDLLALLEIGEADYIFTYRSVAIQHKLKFISLPDEFNLSNPAFNNFYITESIALKGKNPKEKIIQKGEAIAYGVTIPQNLLNSNTAIKFVDFLLSEKGKKIIEGNGLKFIHPISCINCNSVPKELKKYVIVSND